MIPVQEFSQKCLDESPVWAWDDSGDFLFPVAQLSPLPTDIGPLKVRARFTAPNGMLFDGVVNDPPGDYSVTLFVQGSLISLNRNVPPAARKQLQRLFELLGTPPFPLFPLKYDTEYHFAGEPNISGTFEL